VLKRPGKLETNCFLSAKSPLLSEKYGRESAYSGAFEAGITLS